jgi:hypothetical protein
MKIKYGNFLPIVGICVLSLLFCPSLERGDAAGSSYGSLERRPRVVRHEGNVYYHTGMTLQVPERQRSEQESLDSGRWALPTISFPSVYSAPPPLYVWRPAGRNQLYASDSRPLTPPVTLGPTLTVDRFGPPTQPVAKLPVKVQRPGSQTKSKSSTPYLVRPKRPSAPVVTVQKNPGRPPRPNAPGIEAPKPGVLRAPVRPIVPSKR